MVGANDLANLSVTEMTRCMDSLCNWLLLSIIDSKIIASKITKYEDNSLIAKMGEMGLLVKKQTL